MTEEGVTVANTELLLELKAWVRSEWEKKEAGQESEWDQSTWASRTGCGTVCCVAGKTALLNGWKPEFENGADYTIIFAKGGRTWPVDDIAQDVLGLTDEEADDLFEGVNSVEQIERLIDLIVAGEYHPSTWAQELVNM